MGNVTSDLQIWTPDGADLGDPDIYLATMAASIEDGTGERLRKQEQFIGCNLGLSAVLTVSTTIIQAPFAVNQTWNYNDGMTVSGGTVTVPVDGIYTVQVVANYLGTTTTASRINTYLYLNGSAIQFSATYGNTNTIRYANASIANSYKLTAGDDLSVRASTGDANANLQAGAGSGFSVVLTKPL